MAVVHSCRISTCLTVSCLYPFLFANFHIVTPRGLERFPDLQCTFNDLYDAQKKRQGKGNSSKQERVSLQSPPSITPPLGSFSSNISFKITRRSRQKWNKSICRSSARGRPHSVTLLSSFSVADEDTFFNHVLVSSLLGKSRARVLSVSSIIPAGNISLYLLAWTFALERTMCWIYYLLRTTSKKEA